MENSRSLRSQLAEIRKQPVHYAAVKPFLEPKLRVIHPFSCGIHFSRRERMRQERMPVSFHRLQIKQIQRVSLLWFGSPRSHFEVLEHNHIREQRPRRRGEGESLRVLEHF